MALVQEILKREARTRKRGNLTEKFGDTKIEHLTRLKRGVNETWQTRELGCHEFYELEPSAFKQ